MMTSSLVILIVLVAATGCEARSSVEAAQTAVALASTALPEVQTAVPAVQATAQVSATQVSGVLTDSTSLISQLQTVLTGTRVALRTTPSNAAAPDVTAVDVTATDSGSRFGGLDPRTRQAAAVAALLALGQYYPSATITLSVVDDSGTRLVHGTRAAGQLPSVDVP
jgi:hypothetical protein